MIRCVEGFALTWLGLCWDKHFWGWIFCLIGLSIQKYVSYFLWIFWRYPFLGLLNTWESIREIFWLVLLDLEIGSDGEAACLKIRFFAQKKNENSKYFRRIMVDQKSAKCPYIPRNRDIQTNRFPHLQSVSYLYEKFSNGCSGSFEGLGILGGQFGGHNRPI